jgi:hypothetical protein
MRRQVCLDALGNKAAAVTLSSSIIEFLDKCFVDIRANDGYRLIKISSELITFGLNLLKVDKSTF